MRTPLHTIHHLLKISSAIAERCFTEGAEVVVHCGDSVEVVFVLDITKLMDTEN